MGLIAHKVTLRRTWGAPPEIGELTWPEIVTFLEGWSGVPMRSTDPKEKPSDLPLITFGAFDQVDQKGAGYRRTNLNPEGLSCLAYDFDDAETEVFGSVLSQAQKISPRGIVHTTWKSGLVDGVRARIILPSDASIHPAVWESLWWEVARALGAAIGTTAIEGSGLDLACRNPERTYYVPCRNADAPAWATRFEAWGPR